MKRTGAVRHAGSVGFHHPDSHALRLRRGRTEADVAVWHEDVFRIRLRRRGDPDDPSWAVVSGPDPAIPARRRVTARSVVLGTAAGTLRWATRDWSWTLSDRHGLTVFECDGMEAGPEGWRFGLRLAERERVFGMGEVTGAFDQRGRTREFWNMDVLGHAPAIHPQLRGLYVSIPFATSLRDGRVAGLFVDNAGRQVWDVGDTARDRWGVEVARGVADVYLILGPTPGRVLDRYTELTGRIPLPPLWGLGNHQCRYSYESRAELEAVAREFRRRRIPCDALYLDIHHMDGHRVFTFGAAFPRPEAMARRLARSGFKLVAIVDPGVKDDPGFGLLRRGVAADAFVKTADGAADFIGEVWPGKSRFPDFMHAAARAWWAGEQGVLSRAGIAGFWNDMNEPANFARPDKTLPPDARHRTTGGQREHAALHNAYGSEMARASREGALAARPDERPFVITRAGYAGVQRHALVWTGDNSSTWEHLSDAVRMLLNLGASGVPFCGSDVGGFLGNCTPELYVRWLQFAVFTPFMRNHSNIATSRQEPWAFGPGVEALARDYLVLRQRLLPHLYCLLAEARGTGAPAMRPLWWHHPGDPVATACGDQFLLGRDLLVAPVLAEGAVARSVYLPTGVWFDFWSGDRVTGGAHVLAEAGLERIPLYVRAGAILPLWPPAPHVGRKPPDTVTLMLWPGTGGELAWYEDDGAGNGYESGEWSRRSLTSGVRGRTWVVRIGPREGRYAGDTRRWRLVFLGGRQPRRLTFNGRAHAARCDTASGRVECDVADIPGAMEVRAMF